MSNRQLVILVVVAAALVFVTAALYSGKEVQRLGLARGANLVQGLDPGAVEAIVLTQKKDDLKFRREKDGFVIETKENYPASNKQINDFIIRCLDITVEALVTSSPANHKDLGVVPESEDATAVKFLGKDGKVLTGFVKGKSVEGGSGAYVRLLDKDEVYTTKEYLYLSANATDYMDRSLIAVKKDDIKRVEVQAGDTPYVIERGEGDKIALQGIPEGKRAKGTDYERVFEALTSLDLTDIAKAGSLDLAWDVKYVCRLKSGLSYTVELAKKDNEHFVRLSATGPGVDRVTITKTESEDELKKKEALLLAAETAGKFNPRHSPWIYEISSWKAENLRKPFSDLVEDIPKPKEEEPEEIAARHVLVSWKDAEGSSAARTKDEARKLANEVLEKAKAPDADFAKLAEEYSDDAGSKSKGGDLGTFKKGVMVPPFEQAAFKLKVDEISDVVESKFGFHIIQRTK